MLLSKEQLAENHRISARKWYHANKHNLVIDKKAKTRDSLAYYYRNRQECIDKVGERQKTEAYKIKRASYYQKIKPNPPINRDTSRCGRPKGSKNKKKIYILKTNIRNPEILKKNLIINEQDCFVL
jgi:hypothetical protein